MRCYYLLILMKTHRHPIALEQFIMEGSYHKVRSARADVPAESYTYFMDILMDTVRCDAYVAEDEPKLNF